MIIADRNVRARDVALGFAGALVVGVALVTGIGRVAGFSDIRRAVGGADFAWLVICVAGQCAVFAGYTGVVHHAVAAGGGPRLPRRLLLRVVLASFAATQLFAFGGVGGLAVIYWVLRRVGFDRDAAAVRLIGLNTAVYLVFGMIGWTAAVWAAATGTAPSGMTLPWIAGFPLIVVVARWFTDVRRVDRWTASATSARRRALATGVGAAAWVRAALGAPERRPLFGWAGTYWLAGMASLWAALHAYGGAPPLPALGAAYTTGYLAQSLPIPLIATGGVDAATTFLLHAVGVPLDVALLGVVTHRVFAFWLPVLPGSVFAVTLPRIGRSLVAAAPTGSSRTES